MKNMLTAPVFFFTSAGRMKNMLTMEKEVPWTKISFWNDEKHPSSAGFLFHPCWKNEKHRSSKVKSVQA
jgi:hypothetical protein